MFHVHLRPEAKATPLAYREWDCFPGADGKLGAPPAALSKIRLSSCFWPCKYLAGGCCALPGAEREGHSLPLPRAQITLEGTAGLSPGFPCDWSHWPLLIHTRGLEKKEQNLCFKRSAVHFLLSLTEFHSWVNFTSKSLPPMHRSLGTDGVCGLLAMQVMRTSVAASFIFHPDLFFFCSPHHLYMCLCCRIWMLFLLFWLGQGRQMAPPGWWNEIKG